jgi:hypothetical protein
MAQINFDATKVEPADSFEPIPNGDYVIVFVESEFVVTKRGDGKYLQFISQILDGPFKGRKLWTRLNLDNKNPAAVKIAERELSSICHAVNVLHPLDSAELHNIPLTARVEYVPATDTRRAGNEIKDYKSISAANNTPQPHSPVQVAMQPAAFAQPTQTATAPIAHPQAPIANGAPATPWWSKKS